MQRLHLGSIVAVLSGMAVGGCGGDEPSAARTTGSNNFAGNGGGGAAASALGGGGGMAGSAAGGGALDLTCPPAGRDPALIRYVSPRGGGDGLTVGAPYQMADFINEADTGFTGCLLDGVYQGPASMITPPPRSGSAGHTCGPSGRGSCDIMIMAMTDGGAFIDGQFTDGPVRLSGVSYWTLAGFDAGNAGYNYYVIEAGGIWGSGVNVTGLTFKRICASNTMPRPSEYHNVHVWGPLQLEDSLFEDICGFGVGRNIWVDVQMRNSVVRRGWFNWEGYPVGAILDNCGGPVLQPGYHDSGPYTNTFENIIGIHSAEQIVPGDLCYNPTGPESPQGYPMGMGWGQKGHQNLGWLLYAYDDTPIRINHTYWLGNYNEEVDPGPFNIKDAFVDARANPVPPFALGSNGQTAINLEKSTVIRSSEPLWGEWTSVLPPGSPPASLVDHVGVTVTDFNECTSASECPNIYAGVGPDGAIGASLCYRYENGVLQDGSGATTAQPLWPWPMDDRIKAARARAKAQGVGGSPLVGAQGGFYPAETVTSEVVTRYGAIPAQCHQ